MSEAEMWKAFHRMRTVLKEHIARNSEKWRNQVEKNAQNEDLHDETCKRLSALEEVRWKSTGAMLIVATILNSLLAIGIGYLTK